MEGMEEGRTNMEKDWKMNWFLDVIFQLEIYLSLWASPFACGEEFILVGFQEEDLKSFISIIKFLLQNFSKLPQLLIEMLVLLSWHRRW
jgi:hypothetical protein